MPNDGLMAFVEPNSLNQWTVKLAKLNVPQNMLIPISLIIFTIFGWINTHVKSDITETYKLA